MADCISPFSKEDYTADGSRTFMAFPCGKCYPCKQRRVSGWSVRLMAEEKQATSAYFVTFTYNTDHVPITNRGFMSLDGRHPTLFFKRLRKINQAKIKYFLAAEYGTERMRPHYHAVIYNASLESLIGKRFATQVRMGNIRLDGYHPFECKLWPHGHITIGDVTHASVGYTLKYMMKDAKIPLHKNDDRTPEFQRMSKGLGLSYLSPAMVNWFYADPVRRFYSPLLDGKKAPLSRYYKKKLYEPWEIRFINEKIQEWGIVEKKELTGKEQRDIFDVYSVKLKKSRLSEKL